MNAIDTEHLLVKLDPFEPLCKYCHGPMHADACETFEESFGMTPERRNAHDRGRLAQLESYAGEVVMAVQERNLEATFAAVTRWHHADINGYHSSKAWAYAMNLRYGYPGHYRRPLREHDEARVWEELAGTVAHYLRCNRLR